MGRGYRPRPVSPSMNLYRPSLRGPRLDGTTITVTIPSATFDSGFSNEVNTHLAWIVLPAGWTLLDAEAKTVGSQDTIVVTHTCPGTPTNPVAEPVVVEVASPSPSSPSESTSRTPGGDGGSSSGGGGSGAAPCRSPAWPSAASC